MANPQILDPETGDYREMTDAETADLRAAQTQVASAAAASTAEGATADTIRKRLIAGLADADVHIAAISNAPTAAQQKAALLFALKAIKSLGRLASGTLDSPD